jgi:hypothetical protein
MKYTALAIFGVSLILIGYGLLKVGGRVVHVECERTESHFLPVCHVGEYLMGIPNGPPRTVGEITQLANHGKEKREFFLMQRLPNKKVAPITLNKVSANHPADQEPVSSLNRLAEFFREPNEQKIEVKLTNEAGSVPIGIFLFVTGLVMLVISRRAR